MSGTAGAQSNASALPSTASQAVANEVTVAGTIQQVVSDPAAGRPSGIHLLVTSPQGVFDAAVGPFLASDVKDSLSSGQPVKVTGAMRTFNGQQFLLVREMNIAGRQVTIRNPHGFLVRAQLPAGFHAQRSHAGANGGNQ